MDDELPTDFDVIVIGTGMTESIVAAAASRIGKKVLHFDSDEFYGGLSASFNLEALLKIAEEENVSDANTPNHIGLFNIESTWFIDKEPDKPVEAKPDKLVEDKKEENESTHVDNSDDNIKKTVTTKETPKNIWTQNSLKKEYRKFNLDLSPKLLFARGELVELLISSNIARYTEFRCVNRVLTWLNDTLEPVPCSRADVFATKHVTVVEKRMLMKLLSTLMEFDENKSTELHDVENKTFLEYLKSKKLTSNLIHYVLYAIAGGTDSMSCTEGIKKCKTFLTSLGRYGNTPFLWSMYGCGELPQCFCRLCAVYGGVYCLKRPLDSIKVVEDSMDPQKPIEISSNGKILKCEHVVLGVNKVPKDFVALNTFTKGISRAIFVTNRSILEFEKEPLTLLQFPPLQGKKNPVTIIELGPSTYSCPKGLYILHMTSKQDETAKKDLQDYAEKLLNLELNALIPSDFQLCDNKTSKKPQVLWCIYFNMKDTSNENLIYSSHENVHICSGPDTELDFDHAVRQGRNIFNNISKDSEFLPRAPDPEELVFEGEDSNVGPIFEKDISKTENDNAPTANKENAEDEEITVKGVSKSIEENIEESIKENVEEDVKENIKENTEESVKENIEENINEGKDV